MGKYKAMAQAALKHLKGLGGAAKKKWLEAAKSLKGGVHELAKTHARVGHVESLAKSLPKGFPGIKALKSLTGTKRTEALKALGKSVAITGAPVAGAAGMYGAYRLGKKPKEDEKEKKAELMFKLGFLNKIATVYVSKNDGSPLTYGAMGAGAGAGVMAMSPKARKWAKKKLDPKAKRRATKGKLPGPKKPEAIKAHAEAVGAERGATAAAPGVTKIEARRAKGKITADALSAKRKLAKEKLERVRSISEQKAKRETARRAVAQPGSVKARQVATEKAKKLIARQTTIGGPVATERLGKTPKPSWFEKQHGRVSKWWKTPSRSYGRSGASRTMTGTLKRVGGKAAGWGKTLLKGLKTLVKRGSHADLMNLANELTKEAMKTRKERQEFLERLHTHTDTEARDRKSKRKAYLERFHAHLDVSRKAQQAKYKSIRDEFYKSISKSKPQKAPRPSPAVHAAPKPKTKALSD